MGQLALSLFGSGLARPAAVLVYSSLINSAPLYSLAKFPKTINAFLGGEYTQASNCYLATLILISKIAHNCNLVRQSEHNDKGQKE
jgi:hypothetical protein